MKMLPCPVEYLQNRIKSTTIYKNLFTILDNYITLGLNTNG